MALTIGRASDALHPHPRLTFTYPALARSPLVVFTVAGDDAWLVYGDVETYGALAWFSNFLPRTRAAVALVPREGAPTLLLSVGLRDVPAAKTLTWVEDVRPFSRLPRTLVGLIEEKSLQSARLGLASVEELLPVKDWNEITKALPKVRFANRTRELSALRTVKDDCEIEAVRRVANIVSGALDQFAGALKPGVAMREATARIEHFLRANAAEDVRIMVAAGEQAGVQDAAQTVSERLAHLNEVYFGKFGFIFICFATGRSARQMLELLEERLENDRATEIENAAREQARITRLRIGKWLLAQGA